MSKIESTQTRKVLFNSPRLTAALLVACLFIFTSNAWANGGNLDAGFAPGITNKSTVFAVAVQADGKVLIGGAFTAMNGVAINRLARLNDDGTVDTSFNIGGAGANSTVQTIAALPDGRIIIGGDFTAYNGTARGRIARLNPDGSLDVSFVPTGTGFNSTVSDIAPLAGDKIIAVGNFTNFGGTARSRAAVLNSNGTLDTGFIPVSIGSLVNAVVVQTDGKFIIGGLFTLVNGLTANRIARLNTDGTQDTTFNIGTGFNNEVIGLALDSSGRAIAVGRFTAYNGAARGRIARLNTGGTLDTGFIAATGTGGSETLHDVQITMSGEIFVSGLFGTFNGSSQFDFIVRLFSDGSVDSSFNPANPAIGGFFPTIERLAAQTDGKIIGIGDFVSASGTLRHNVVRFNADGTVDTGFEVVPGVPAIVNEVVVKPDGKFVVGGDFEAAGRYVRFYLAQINADGTTDTTFNPGSGPNTPVSAIAVQPDGKIIIGGSFTSFNGTTRNFIARVNVDGSLDLTFTIGTGASNAVREIALQPDGKILIGGDFTVYNGTSRIRLARLNSNGTLDTTFNVGTGPNVGPLAIAVQTDGQVIIGGNFTTYNGSAVNRLARLNADGSLDTGFNPAGAGANNTVRSAAIQTDGKIVIGGSFISYNGTTRNSIARVNTDGTLDTTFNPGTGATTGIGTPVLSVAIQTDSKILIGGDFTTYNGTTITRVARVNSDGSLDTTFLPPGGANSTVNSLAIQTDGEILAGGVFSVFNATPRLALARIQPGDNIVWNGGVSTNWNTAANWTPAQVPTSADAVLIPSVGVTNEPALIGSVTVASLIVETGRTVTIPGGILLTAVGLSNSGTIAGPGILDLSGSTFVNNGVVSADAQVGGGGSKILSGVGSFTNNFAIGSATTLRLSSNHQFGKIVSSGLLDVQSFTISLSGAGDALGSGAVNVACSGCTFNYNGTAAQSIRQIRFAAGYDNLTINNAAGVSLINTIGVNNNLTLTGGSLTTGAFKLTAQQDAAVTRTAGYVIGKFEKIFPVGGANFTFHTGTANGYSPVVFNASAGAGSARSVEIETFQTNQPSLPVATSLARFWSITAGADITQANLVFNYLQTDVMGNETNYGIFRVSGTTPTSFPNQCPASPCVDTTANTATIDSVTQFSDWTLSESAPSAVKLEKFAATGYDGGVYLEWKTGLEADNLGFNLYRERAGKKELVNAETIAGSALLTGQTRLQTGRTYSWWDAATRDQERAQYWLEDIDLNGQSNWHGPVSAQLIGGTPPAQSHAAVLSLIGTPQTSHASTPVERKAPARASSGQARIQPVPAGATAVKVSVRREDWYRLSLTELVAAGFNPKPDPDRLQIYVDGEQIPINVITDDKKQLSAIEFYGTGLDAAYTDAHVYLIVEGTEKGLRIGQVNADAHPSGARSFSDSVERRDRTIYFSGLRNGERENFFGAVVGREAVVQSLTLQHLDRSTTEQSQVEVSLQGVTTLPHRVWVNVNGSFAGEVLFNGQEVKAASFSLLSSLLREGNNEVQLAAQGGPADVSLIDYVRVSYPRTFTAESDQLRFVATAGAAVTVDGFSSAAIRVFDVTNQDRVQQLAGKIEQSKNGYTITVAAVEKGERKLLAIAGQAPGVQPRVSASVASDLRNTNHTANLVIITNRDLLSALEPLKKLRTSQGYKVEIVDVEAIYDQFSFGSKSPYAVREFLQYAAGNWKIAPQYLLLAGDASYDPKNYLGFGDWDIVPTKLLDTGLMETASDDWLADFNADGVPEMAIGRLPARSKEEAESMVARIIGYEQTSGATELTLVADANDGYDFEAATAQLRALVPGDIRVVEIDRGRMGNQAKPVLIEAINRGQKIVNYTGHGNVDQWRADLLTSADAALLTNQNHLAVFVMMTCLNGYFEDPGLSSLAEALMKSPGGAVAVWASSGMTMADGQALMNRELYRQLFANRGITLGDAIKRAKAATSDGDIRRTWILLGDPSMRVR